MLRRHHQLIRFGALLVAGASMTSMALQSHWRIDLTEEGLSQISPDTRSLVANLEEPVVIHAFVSREVPREHVEARARLLNLLDSIKAEAGPGLTVRVVETSPHSLQAEEALENFDIAPRQLIDQAGGRIRSMDVFLGVAMVSGPRKQVIPFLDRGLSVEYELNRALRVVTQTERQTIGVLQTDARWMGWFDMQQGRPMPAWRIVDELKKSYDVRSIEGSNEIPADIDILIVPQLSSCTQQELDHVRNYVDAGRPALLTIDPAPVFDLRLMPRSPKLPAPNQQQMGMFGGSGGEQKGDYEQLLSHFGVAFDDQRVVFDHHNPNPMLETVDAEIVFITRETGGIEHDDSIVSDLSQVAMLYAGAVRPEPGTESSFKPLLQSTMQSGLSDSEQLFQSSPFGPRIPVERIVTGERYTIAARITGGADSPPADEPTEGSTNADTAPRNIIVMADLDLFGDGFFQLDAQGGDLDGDGLDDIRFDNVQFLLNAVDSLAGDTRFVELRNRRPKFRRLTKVDAITLEARSERLEQMQAATRRAEEELNLAQQALDEKVKAVVERQDLDETTKEISLASIQAAEQRRLEARTVEIEREKAKAVEKVTRQSAREIDAIQNWLRLLSVIIPPLPALLLGGIIFSRKRRREYEAVPRRRRAVNKRGEAA